MDWLIHALGGIWFLLIACFAGWLFGTLADLAMAYIGPWLARKPEGKSCTQT